MSFRFASCLLGLTLFAISILAYGAAPAYGPSCELAGAVRQVGTLPGGGAVYAVEAPINATDLVLHLKLAGAVKVTITQPGTAESIEMGFTLLWEEQPDPQAAPHAHDISLDNFIMRWPKVKALRYSCLTCSNVYFIQVRPATQQKLAIESVALTGSEPVPASVPATGRTLKGVASTKGGFTILSWRDRESVPKWWGRKPLPAGKDVSLGGIPFHVSPVVLEKKGDAASIRVGQKAGLIHIAHGVENAVTGQDWVATYDLEYGDGSHEMIFANLGWNCGTYSGGSWCDSVLTRTWWGPPGYTAAKVHFLPQGGPGTTWNGIYVATVRNPRPEQAIKAVHVSLPEAGSFALAGLTFTPPEQSMIGLVEPDRAVLFPGHKTTVQVMLRSALPMGGQVSGELFLTKPDKRISLGKVSLKPNGSFAYGELEVAPPDGIMEPGPVRLDFAAGGQVLAQSSLLGWMPARDSTDLPYAFTMIAGGKEPQGEWERIYRLGYDAVKVQMGWRDIEPASGKFTWDKWEFLLSRIHSAGLKVELRNRDKVLPEWLRKKVSMCLCSDTGESANQVDLADPEYQEAIVRYYGEVGRFAARHPYVRSINTSYMTHTNAGMVGSLYYGPNYQMKAFRDHLRSRSTLAAVNAWTGRQFAKWDDITPSAIMQDESGWLVTEFVRYHDGVAADVQRQVVKAIRATGCRAHLTFNVAYHYLIQRLKGLTFDEYLRLGREFPPSSPFHETSDRYCLSFSKWLAAKRTFDLPYGDEGCINPPPDEHNVVAYQWMLIMQCWDAIYCQWSSGIPASQNIAWLKPYHDLVYRAEYLPDPVGLALSCESAFAETPAAIREKKRDWQALSMSHYGLANALRATNVNADRYVMDRFPEMDAKAPKLLIDDIGRYIRDDFADRLGKFVTEGGTFIVSGETDGLHQGKFLKRFGVSLESVAGASPLVIGGSSVMLPGSKYRVLGKAVRPLARWSDGSVAIGIQSVGRGKLVIWGPGWNQDGFESALPEEYLHFLAATLGRLGSFRPNVWCDTINISVTPYRTRTGSILVHVFNTTAGKREVQIGLRKDLMVSVGRVLDLGLGRDLAIQDKGAYWRVGTNVSALHSTLLEFRSR